MKTFPYIPKDQIKEITPIRKAEFNTWFIPNLRVAFACEHCDHCMVEQLIVDVPESMGGSKTVHGILSNRLVCTNPECDSKNTFKFVEIED